MTSIHCEIRVNGHLSSQWTDWFSGLKIENQANGEALLSGILPDQAALHGVLKCMSNLGVTLVSMNCSRLNADQTPAQQGRIPNMSS
jgi:hypothetical protein